MANSAMSRDSEEEDILGWAGLTRYVDVRADSVVCGFV